MIKQSIVVIMILGLFGLICSMAEAKSDAKHTVKPLKPQIAEIMNDCGTWDDQEINITITMTDGRKFTARLWGALLGEFRNGKTISYVGTDATLYHDVSGKTGEANLCEQVGPCNPVKVELNLPLTDKAKGYVIIGDEKIPTISAYDSTRTAICG